MRLPDAAALYLFLSYLALPQNVIRTSVIEGSVSDTTGAAIAGARVTARLSESGMVRSGETNGDGRFTLRGLTGGEWSLTVEKAGFSTLRLKEFELAIGEVAVQHLTLSVGQASDRIEVTERADVVESTATTSSAALGSSRIEEAPAKSRNYMNFVSLAPGLVPSAGSGVQRSMTGIRNPMADSGFSFGGLRGRNNSINIDGVDNRDETTGGNRVAIGLEMVQEFRVAGVGVGAEFGGAAGGMVNVVTRTGVNLWHGDMTFFGQNEALNARKAEVPPGFQPRFRRYQPGASIGGPIRRDRTFFFGGVEHERESGEEWSETPDEAEGVINRVLASGAYPGLLTRTVLRGLFPTGQRGIEGSVKVNHQVGERDSLAVRYAFSSGRVLNDVQGVENFQDVSASGRTLTTDHSLVGNWMRMVTPTLVHELRVQAAERRQSTRPNSSGALIEIPGVVSFGQAYRLNADRTEKHGEIVEALNFSLGRHRLSVGGDVHVIDLDARMANRFGGIFIFPTLADFAAGRPDVFLQAFGEAGTRLTTAPLGAWIQDRWEVRRGLTLEGGLRFDRQRMPAGLPSPGNNWSPRAGIAWKPAARRPLVFRAGFGLFYDRFPLAYLNEAVQKDGVRGFEQYAAGDDAAAVFRLRDGGSAAAPVTGIARAAYRANAYFPTTYSRKFSAGVEQGLGKNTTLTIEASHVRGFHLPRIRNASGGLPPVYQLEQSARSFYRGFSLSLNRRLSRGTAFLVAYDAGTAEDDGSDFDEQPQDPRNARADWGRSRQYQLQRFAASGVFDLPTEDMQGLPGLLREALDEVTVSPTVTAGSGRALNALLSTDAWRTGAYPITARPAGFVRNPYLTPGTVSMDLRVMKTIKVMKERALLQFGAEAFNLFNHFNTVKVSEFYSSANGRLPSYGQSIESGNSRQLQLFMQFEY